MAHYHFLIFDCDEIGNLLQTYVFVQFVGIKMESEISHLLVCRTCNTEAESLQQILMKGNLDRKFLEDQKKKYCIHCKTLSKLNPETYYPIDEHFFPWFFASDLTDIEHIQSKPLLAAVLAGGEYGLVSLPPRAKKLRCVFPHKESKVCSHVQTFERNEGTIKESEIISIGKN